MYVGAFGHTDDATTVMRAADIFAAAGESQLRFIVVGDGVKRAEWE